VDGRRSTTEIVFFLCECLVRWQSTKQRLVAVSSCEVEYVAVASVGCQIVWLVHLLTKILKKELDTLVLWIDNKPAISLVKNPVLNDRSRHIDTRFHLIRDYDANGQICVKFIRTKDQLGDLFTKSLSRVKFQDLSDRVGLRYRTG
jgi:hypothetical protein